eukprot:gnl/TRDRNA2_/TRDRNA2_173452_c0_seq1.p1 gnl/TRDRNA2_/TRDRNA2_173452_c0~~gnl/TRDRNA2_/TRDRNA2_173452_c0_seq1.p1  ORF type:complete len:335 (+),score=33.25 gnl/TRDRNA2_/TRDRNA2_173452_c0_seq1:64-1068(+)
MMWRVIVSILCAFVIQGHAKETASSHANRAQEVKDKVADRMVENMFDRALKVSSLPHAQMDNTTLGNPFGRISLVLQNAFLNIQKSVKDPKANWKTTRFWGPVANWGLVASAVYDAAYKGPEIIDVGMTTTMVGYSSLFMAFAWQVQPRSMLLFSCHLFNVLAQCNQMRRAIEYKVSTSATAAEEIKETLKKQLMVALAAGAFCASVKPLKIAMFVNRAVIPTMLRQALIHPAGPLTVFFWAPASKWLFSINNLKDIHKPTDTISISQMAALSLTGLIWMRYSFVITPVNYNLAAVNVALGGSSLWHLGRKINADYIAPKSPLLLEQGKGKRSK